MRGDNEGDGDTPSTEGDTVATEKARAESESLGGTDIQTRDLGAPSPSVVEADLGAVRGRVSYSSVLVEGSAGVELSPEFVVKDGVAAVEIPAELLDDSEPLWKCFLVGYFMSEAPHIGSIHATVNRLWAQPGRKSRIDVQLLGRLRFCSELRMQGLGTES